MAKYLSFFFLFLVAAIQLLSAASDRGKIEITAKDVVAAADIIKAKGDVVVHYEDSVIKANSATYDKSKQLLILDGKIEMIGYDGSKEHSDHIEIYTETKEVTFDELFLIGKNDIWLFSKDAHKQGTNYILGPSLISSCDMEDPTWKMAFSRSEYDSDEKYMKIHDAKVYLWDTPIFYTPYLAFSVDRQRTSGLLFPVFGYNSNEGFLYEQPIYWAIAPNIDMEFKSSYGNPSITTGDIDNDGYDDLVIGSTRADGDDSTRSNAGQVMVIFGREQQHPYTKYDQADDNSDEVGLVIHGADGDGNPAWYRIGDMLGNSVACGDIDGDGYEDIIIGALYGDSDSIFIKKKNAKKTGIA